MSAELKQNGFYEVVIVGAGPVGLALATHLLNKGVPASSILLLDRRRDFTPESESRASLVTPCSMGYIEHFLDGADSPREVDASGHRVFAQSLPYNAPFDEINTKSVTGELLQRALLPKRVLYCDRDFSSGGVMARVDLASLQGTKYPFATSIAQGFIERAIAARFATLGGTLHRQWKVVKIDHTSSSQEDQKGKTETKISFEWLGKEEDIVSSKQMDVFAGLIVGADGGHSVVRREAGIVAEGYAWPGDFLVADVRTKDSKWPFESAYLGTSERALMPTTSEYGMTAMLPLPGGIFRVVGNLWNFERQDMVVQNYENYEAVSSDPSQAATSGAKAPVTKEMMQQFLDQRGPDMSKYKPTREEDVDRPSEITEVLWASVYKIQSRIASTMFEPTKRTAIIGDSAHQHAPAGGQGLNAGFVDAFSLGKVLTEHLQSGRPSLNQSEAWHALSADLQAWTDRRRPQVIRVSNFANALHRVGSIRGPWLSWLRTKVVRLLQYWIAPKMAYGLSVLGQTI